MIFAKGTHGVPWWFRSSKRLLILLIGLRWSTADHSRDVAHAYTLPPLCYCLIIADIWRWRRLRRGAGQGFYHSRKVSRLCKVVTHVWKAGGTIAGKIHKHVRRQEDIGSAKTDNRSEDPKHSGNFANSIFHQAVASTHSLKFAAPPATHKNKRLRFPLGWKSPVGKKKPKKWTDQHEFRCGPIRFMLVYDGLVLV